jgi:hypothetical protein
MFLTEMVESSYELSSGASRLVIDGATGHIERLTHHSRVLIPVAGSRGPVRLHLPLPNFEAHMVDVGQQEPEIDAAVDAIVCRYPCLMGKRGALNIALEMRVSSLGDGRFAWSCRLHNGSAYVIPQLFFPWISGFTPVDGEEDQVTFAKSTFKKHFARFLSQRQAYLHDMYVIPKPAQGIGFVYTAMARRR